jgi:hypothetical protein
MKAGRMLYFAATLALVAAWPCAAFADCAGGSTVMFTKYLKCATRHELVATIIRVGGTLLPRMPGTSLAANGATRGNAVFDSRFLLGGSRYLLLRFTDSGALAQAVYLMPQQGRVDALKLARNIMEAKHGPAQRTDIDKLALSTRFHWQFSDGIDLEVRRMQGSRDVAIIYSVVDQMRLLQGEERVAKLDAPRIALLEPAHLD